MRMHSKGLVVGGAAEKATTLELSCLFFFLVPFLKFLLSTDRNARLI